MEGHGWGMSIGMSMYVPREHHNLYSILFRFLFLDLPSSASPPCPSPSGAFPGFSGFSGSGPGLGPFGPGLGLLGQRSASNHEAGCIKLAHCPAYLHFLPAHGIIVPTYHKNPLHEFTPSMSQTHHPPDPPFPPHTTKRPPQPALQSTNLRNLLADIKQLCTSQGYTILSITSPSSSSPSTTTTATLTLSLTLSPKHVPPPTPLPRNPLASRKAWPRPPKKPKKPGRPPPQPNPPAYPPAGPLVPMPGRRNV